MLAAAVGIGFLAGSLIVTVFPLHGEPERLVARLAVVIAASLGLCGLAPTYPWALAAFVLSGAVTAPFVTATLASRSVYSPPGARAQVFVSIAGLKVAAGSALVGVSIGLGPRPLLGVAALVTLLAVAVVVLDRRRTDRGTTREDSRVDPRIEGGRRAG